MPHSADEYARLRERFNNPGLSDSQLKELQKEVGDDCLLCFEINQVLSCASARLLGSANTRPKLVEAYELSPVGSHIRERIYRAIIEYDTKKLAELEHVDMILTYMEGPYMEPDIKEKFRLRALLLSAENKSDK